MFIRDVLENSDLSSLWSSSLRMVVGTVIIALWLGYKRNLTLSTLSFPQWQAMTGAAFGGSFVGLWLHQTAFQFAPVGIAATLLSTSPLFAVGISVYLREKVTWRSLGGVLVALVGIGLLLIQSS